MIFSCADVDENCQFRQNLATANAVYGPADALNACTYSSFIDMEKIWSFKNIEVGLRFLKLSKLCIVCVLDGETSGKIWRTILQRKRNGNFLDE
jgi:hypothetical protein